jgi:tRNA uridine 5-carbamoylmethylation protein Kti12
MKKITLIRGLPGAGKTTFAKKMCEDLTAEGQKCIWLESSMYTEETGEKIVSTKQTPIVTKWLLGKVEVALGDYDNVIVSRVAMDDKDINLFKHIADINEAEFVVYRLNTHWIDKCPKAILEKMQKDFRPWPDEIVIS